MLLQFAGFGGRFHAGAVLFQRDVRVPHIQQCGVLQLLQLRLDLALREDRALVVRLRRTVANGKQDIQRHLIIGEIIVKRRTHGVATTGLCRAIWSKLRRGQEETGNRIAVCINDRCPCNRRRSEPCLVARESDSPVLRRERRRWQQGVARRFDVNLAVLQIERPFLKLGPLPEGFLYGLFKGGSFNGFGPLGQVRVNDLHVHKIGSQRILADGVLQDLLILKLNRLRNDQVLAIGGEFGFGTSDIERGHGSDLELFLVVVIEFLGNGRGLLLNFHVFPREHKLPIGSDCVRGGGNRLLRKRPIRDFAIVLGDTNIPCVDRAPKAIQ